mgnify:CR=1 FL=1
MRSVNGELVLEDANGVVLVLVPAGAVGGVDVRGAAHLSVGSVGSGDVSHRDIGALLEIANQLGD